MIRRKKWSEYTASEIADMKKVVIDAPAEAPLSPEYAAAYLGKSLHTLQSMRCRRSNAISYSKIGHHIVYRKKSLDEYVDKCAQNCTASSKE